MSKRCGKGEIEKIGENCAIVLGLKDIFPDVNVTGEYIHPCGIDNHDQWDELKIGLPKIAQDFIKNFDSLCRSIPKDPVAKIFSCYSYLPAENNLYIIQCLIDIKRKSIINLKYLLTPKFPEQYFCVILVFLSLTFA